MLTERNASTARRGLGPVTLLACLVALLAFAGSAQAARNIVTGFADGAYTSASESERIAAFDTTEAVGSGLVRLDVSWRAVAGEARPGQPKNPADPSYNFSGVDAGVREANARGLDVMLTIYSAPAWAEGPDRPPVSEDVPAGTWRPHPPDLRDFATAIASRYSGRFDPGGGILPRVDNFEAWNEENLWVYLSPQYSGNGTVATEHYRSMLNAFFSGIKAANSKSTVLVGGNAPYGDPPGGHRIRPLLFLKRLFCLTAGLKPTSCPNPAKFDVLGVHPINLSGGPTQSAINDDDVSSADVPQVVKVLRAAEAANTLATPGQHDLWATEFWWESYPDGGATAIPGLAKHALWVEQALYLFWKARVKVAINLQLTDTPANGEDELNTTFQTGIFLADGTPKPAATSFRFPFVLDRKSKSEAFIWGKSPQKGKLTIEKEQGGGWRKVATLKVKTNKVFTSTLNARGKGKYRATIGDQTSLVWTLRK